MSIGVKMHKCAWLNNSESVEFSYNNNIYASVRMRREAYGSHFVCVCVCVFRAHLLFPWTLGTGKCFYRYYTVFSKYAICRFARQSLVFETRMAIFAYLEGFCERLGLLQIKSFS